MNSDRVVILEHEAALQALGLHTVEGAAACKSGRLIDDHRGNRDVLRIEVSDPVGRPVTLFVKRMWKSDLKDSLRSVVRHGRVWSKARTEFENYLAARTRGIDTPTLVAYGERCGLLTESFSYIVTEAAPGQPLDEWLMAHRGSPRRVRVLSAVGRFVRSMHDSGIAFPDLFARHIFVVPAGCSGHSEDRVRFSLIDVARLELRRCVGEARRVRDLAVLSLSMPLREVPLKERLACLRGYELEGDHDSKLSRRISACMARLLRRERFRRQFDGAVATLAIWTAIHHLADGPTGLLDWPFL